MAVAHVPPVIDIGNMYDRTMVWQIEKLKCKVFFRCDLLDQFNQSTLFPIHFRTRFITFAEVSSPKEVL